MKHILVAIGLGIIFSGCTLLNVQPEQPAVIEEPMTQPSADLEAIEAEMDDLDATADFGAFSEDDF